MAKATIYINPDSKVQFWAGNIGIVVDWEELLQLINHPQKDRPYKSYASIEVGD